jgi:ParB-like chromosome segregation protein Spo0J
MIIELKKLKPNPTRDFKVDPVDQQQIRKLVDSINDYGFWGGTVCRHGNKNGNIEVVAGWTRVQAAIEKGIKTADLFVGKFDDIATAKAYAIENTTQRGNTVTALAGSVATAIAMLARGILLGDKHISQICDISPKALECARGNLASGKGIGEPLIGKFLEGTGIKESEIREQVASLKKSGDYKRIITEVTDRIQEEAKTEEKEAEKESEREEAKAKGNRAKAAKDKVSHDKKEFDFQGVSKHLSNKDQIHAFREVALKAGVKPYLPVSMQAPLAAELVKFAKEQDEELSGRFIKMNMMVLLSGAKDHERKLSKQEKARLLAESIQNQFDESVLDMRRAFSRIGDAGTKILKLMSQHRKIEFRISNCDLFVMQIISARDMLDKLADGLAGRSSPQQKKILAKLK